MKKLFQICILSLFIISTLFLFARPVEDAQENFNKMIVLADKIDSDIQVLNSNLEKLLDYYTKFEATRTQIDIENTSLDIDRVLELMNKMGEFEKIYEKIKK